MATNSTASVAIPQPLASPRAGASRTQFISAETRRLLYHSSHYLAGFTGNIIIGLVSFPIFTRVFSAAEYGTIDLAQRVLLIVTIACKAGFQNGALRFYDATQFENNKQAARSYYSTMLFGMLFTSSLVVLVVIVVCEQIPGLLPHGTVQTLLYFVCGIALLRAAGSILWAFLRIEERTKAFNLTSVATKAGTVIAICTLLLFMERSAKAYFAGTAAVELLLVLGLIGGLLWRGMLSIHDFDRKLFRAGLLFGVPLVLYEFAFAVLGSADRFMVRHYLGADALGFYSVAHGLARNVNELLVAPLGLAILPIYMRLWKSDGPEKTADFLNVALNLFIAAAVGVLAIVTASAKPLVIILASDRYAGTERLVPIILAALLVYASHVFVAAGLLIQKKTLQMAGVLAIAAVLNVILNVLLLPRIGLLGGALATLLSCTACIVALGAASKRFLRLRLQSRLVTNYLFAGALAWLTSLLITTSTPAVTLISRSCLSAAIYIGTLYLIDPQIRSGLQSVARRIQTAVAHP